MSSTKLDFSVESFDFRPQVEAHHHGAKKHTSACLRLNLILVWDHLILDRPPRSNKTQTHTADHTGKKQQHTPLTAGTQRSHSGQHTPLTQPAHSAHTAGSTQTIGAAVDSAHKGGSTQTTGVVANRLHVRVLFFISLHVRVFV